MLSTLAIGLALAALGQLNRPQPEPQRLPPAPAGPRLPWVQIVGRVVDDRTGAPVESFKLEADRVPGDDPGAVAWGGSTMILPNYYTIKDGKATAADRNSVGKFELSVGFGQAGAPGHAWLRVLADGYEPRPVTDRSIGPEVSGKTIEVTVRLRRGSLLSGRVVDHSGRPAAGARTFLIRPGRSHVRIVDDVIGEGSDTGLLDPGVTRAVADAEGRFVLGGADGATAIGVSAGLLHFYKAPIGPPGEESTIRLPEPGILRLPYAIEGDEAEAVFELYRKDPGGPESDLTVRRTLRVANGGALVIPDASPGEYQLWRKKPITHGNYRGTVGLDDRKLMVESGQVTVAAFVRDRGVPIEGRVIGPAQGQARMMFVGIEPVARPPDLGPRMLDIAACDPDGRFRTSRIPPGDYVVRAVGYRFQPRYGPFFPIIEGPDFQGSTPATVTPAGKSPEVRIQLAGPPKRGDLTPGVALHRDLSGTDPAGRHPFPGGDPRP